MVMIVVVVASDGTLTSDIKLCSLAGEVLFADVLLLLNGMSKVGANA